MVLTSTKTDRRRPPRPPVPDPASPANPASSRPAAVAAADDSQRASQRMRPSTTPAYYLGRPASYWLALYRHRHASA